MADNTIQTATDGNFEAEVLTASNSQPVMVDFWAEWCRPCHMLAPTVAEIAHDYAGKLKVMKLNVDEAMNSAGRYRVQGIRHCCCSRTDRSSSRSWEQCRRSKLPRRWSGTSRKFKSNCGAPRSDQGAPIFRWPPWFHLPLPVRVLT